MVRRLSILSFGVLALLVCYNGAEAVPQAVPKPGDPKNPQVKPDDKKKMDEKKKADDKKKADEKKKTEPKVDPPKPKPPVTKPEDTKTPEPDPDDVVDTTRATRPLDLLRGLREKGLPDLAIEYISELEKKNVPADVKAVLPLEKARARLEALPMEPEEGKRTAMLSMARAEFEKFVKDQGKHPRVSEAALSLAQVTSILARTQLAKASSLESQDRRKSEAVKVRPVFEDAAKKYDAAAKQIASALATAEGARKIELQKDLNKAELEHGIVLYRMSETYFTGGAAAETKARGEVLNRAKAQFKKLSDKDINSPTGWAAKAWYAECDGAMQNQSDADKMNERIRVAANSNMAAREGLRMSRYFDVLHKYETASSVPDMQSARREGERWLAEFRNTVRPTPEQFSITYYVAFLKKQEGLATGVKEDPKTKKLTVSPGAVRLFKEAEREFRALMETDNDYAERAARQRTQCVRLIIGDAAKPATSYLTFEECQMAAVVSIDQAFREDTDEAKTKRMQQAAELLERAQMLAGPTVAPKDLLEAQIQQIYAYQNSGQQPKAAILGEHVARTARYSGPGARAGAMAVSAYLNSAPKSDAATDPDLDTSKLDRERAMQLATFLESKYPTDPPTDATRVMLGDLLLKNTQYQDAFTTLSRVSAGFPDQVRARLLLSVAAFNLVGDKSKLDPKAKKDIYDSTMALLKAVVAPGPDAPVEDARAYLRLRQQQASLNLLAGPAAAATAKATAAAMYDEAALYSKLSEPMKRTHQFEAERLRLMAVFAAAKPLFDEQKYKESSALLDPLLTEMAKSLASGGSATAMAQAMTAKKDKDGKAMYEEGQLGEASAAAAKLDGYRRDAIVVLTLQNRIRSGAADQAAELIELMKKLGGNLEANAQTLANLARTVRDQAAELRKAGKADEAEKVTSAVGALFEKIADEPNQSIGMQIFYGIALRDLGRTAKAIEILSKIQPPAEADLKAGYNTLPEEKKISVRLYRGARLELARAYKVAKQYDKADEVLTAALGTDKAPGWAKGSLEFRKEVNLVLEARATDETDTKKKGEYWGKAKQGWDKLANEYGGTLQALLRQPLSKDDPAKANQETRQRDSVKNTYFELFSESIRCVVLGNAQLLKDKPDVLAQRLQKIAEQLVTVETKNTDLSPETKAKFAAILNLSDKLKELYGKAGGKEFLQPAGGQ
jgi:hypothetical protein